LTLEILQEKYGAGWVFIVFAVISILSLFFVYFLIPETKGKSLEQIQRMLKGDYHHSIPYPSNNN